jgi:hypothetical protein
MTVKTQGGKVITKGGKVSCECCGEVVDCCVYGADLIADAVYSEDDFPDAIRITRGSQTEVINRSGFEYIGSIFSAKVIDREWVFTGPGDEQWAQRECLFTNDSSVRDFFNDTYQLQNNSIIVAGGPCGLLWFNTSTTLLRTSACTWTGNVTILSFSPFTIEDESDPCFDSTTYDAIVTLQGRSRDSVWEVSVFVPELNYTNAQPKYTFLDPISTMKSPAGSYFLYNVV